MTMGVFDFKAIARKLNRQEQKAEFEEKNPPAPEPSMYGWPYGVACPLAEQGTAPRCKREATDLRAFVEAFQVEAATWETVESDAVLKSLAHPEWPYAGTPHAWTKFANESELDLNRLDHGQAKGIA